MRLKVLALPASLPAGTIARSERSLILKIDMRTPLTIPSAGLRLQRSMTVFGGGDVYTCTHRPP